MKWTSVYLKKVEISFEREQEKSRVLRIVEQRNGVTAVQK